MNYLDPMIPDKTRLAFLSTIGPLHLESLTYDVECLRSILLAVSPDILCVEIMQSDWEDSDLTKASVEVREVLAHTTSLMDTVLVPIAPSSTRFEDFSSPPGLRLNLMRALGRFLTWGQRMADNPKAIHGPMFETFCHTVCMLTEMTWSASECVAWEAQNIELADVILAAIRRDPGCRMLVAVQCQRIHNIEPVFRKLPNELELVNYWEL
jgi:hypothetical protein